MSSWEQVVEAAGPHQHLVQFYEADRQALARNVGQYLADGLKRGEGLLLLATPDHSRIFFRAIKSAGANPRAALRSGRLVMQDAGQTLERILIDGRPDRERFQSVIGAAARTLKSRAGCAGLRAYGELVALLWEQGQRSAALALEELWNELLRSVGFQLFCAYPVDVFGKAFHSDAVDSVLCAHTRLVSSGADGEMDRAVDQAMDELLAPNADDVRFRIARSSVPRIPAPAPEASILWLRRNLPEVAEAVVDRARQYYNGEKRFRALIENSSDAISLIDPRGQVLYASSSTARILGYLAEELVGRNGFDLLHPDDAPRATRMLEAIVARPRRPVHAQARVRRKDGQWRWVEITCTNLLDEPDVRAVVLNYRDITARKAAEEEKRRYAEELTRANAELQAFAYAATHDLKEPLRTICAFTQLLVERAPLDQTGREHAAYIVEGAKRMSVLLDDLLSLHSLSLNGRHDRVELDQALTKALQNLDQAIKESGAEISANPLPATRGSESRLTLLFQNLISNAIKYRGEAPVRIRVAAARRGREWLVTVADNGIGIDPEYREQIFGLFKRLHNRDIPGTGIGLAICSKIVEGMGGKIWVESEPGKGSTFCFTVPFAGN
ncbi:MAG: PAS domain S-box protein [Bryobacteraceae bacterium]|nr:PAS domain S-box protein [Bryobacteraceae bacterium]